VAEAFGEFEEVEKGVSLIFNHAVLQPMSYHKMTTVNSS